LSSATNALFANANGGIFATAADALAFSLLLMTQVEGHRSFDLRIFVDCSVPRSTHRSSFRRTLLRWRRREFRLLWRWKGGESVALPYHRGRPGDRGGALPSEGRGREFESRRVRQLFQLLKLFTDFIGDLLSKRWVSNWQSFAPRCKDARLLHAVPDRARQARRLGVIGCSVPHPRSSWP
jgi:hypothetical protein